MLTKPLDVPGFPVTLAFASDGIAYLSERITGRLWEIDFERIEKDPDSARLITELPVVALIGNHESGFTGIALDPAFDSNGLIYCYYTHRESNGAIENRVVRVRKDGSGQEVVLDGMPGGRFHDGGVLAFGLDGTLYIGNGECDDPELAQDVKSLGGKLLRINPDGSIPADNPFPGSPVYAYGFRDIFGIAVHPETGTLYVNEEGPDTDDEIDMVEKGGNYGWPTVTGIAHDKRFVDPIKTYSPTITPVQGMFVGRDYYFGSYNEGTVHKLTLGGDNDDQVVGDEIVYRSGTPWSVIGAFHSPKGQFYVTTPSSVVAFTPTG